MFDKNTLTFNPGWDSNARRLDALTDIRGLQRHLKGQGIGFVGELDESITGPASSVMEHPDGNLILVDQLV